MLTPRTQEQEVLLALYRYTLLTTDQLCTLLHYRPNTMYQTLSKMRKLHWTQPMRLAFLRHNVKGWALTKEGLQLAFGLTKETRSALLRQPGTPPSQAVHLYGTNRFFTNLISESLSSADEGLVEWIGMRDSGDRYSTTNAKGRRATPIRPDGIGTYRFEDGSVVTFHVEYDTGSEHAWTLYQKLWTYALHLPKFWADVGLANVLFITREEHRARRIVELWDGLLETHLKRQQTPAVWAISERRLDSEGVLGAVWSGSSGSTSRLGDFPQTDGDAYRSVTTLGKQRRLAPFVKGS
ncbi:MAG: replication-relaxation family protein [Bacilli bacterium]